MAYAMIALLMCGLLLAAGCRPDNPAAQHMLDEIVRQNGELMTLTAINGVLGAVLVLLAAGLAAAMLARRKGGGNGE